MRSSSTIMFGNSGGIAVVTGNLPYLQQASHTKSATLVDPVWEQVERDRKLQEELQLTLRYCMETHIHADPITGTGQLCKVTGCLSIVPENAHAACADRFIKDGEVVQLGDVRIEAIATPGDTDSHMAYLVNGTHLITGDSLLHNNIIKVLPQLLYASLCQKFLWWL